MSDVVEFAILGIAVGALYAIIAQGVVLIYRGSGVLNFAQGAFVMVGAYIYYEVRVSAGLGSIVAIPAAIIGCALLGALVHLLIFRRLHNAPTISKIVATLGILVVLESAATLHYGTNVLSVPSSLPTRTIEFIHNVPVGLDRVNIFFIGLVLTVVLWAVYRYTSFGRITSGVAENQFIVASLGRSPDAVGTANWAIGAALGGLGGVLIGPITFLQPSELVLLVLPTMAAALAANLSSFPIAFVASLVIGVIESELTRYVSNPGWSESVPFVLVAIILVVRGSGLPPRSYLVDRLPKVGSGRVRPIPVAICFVALGSLLLFAGLSYAWASAFTVTIVMTVMCLAIVVITGYGGQISLTQYVLGGLSAFFAARMMISWGFPFLAAVIVSILLVVAVGAIVGLTALRTRGTNLAIATLGLAVLIYDLVLDNPQYNGGLTGLSVSTPDIFGWNIDPLAHANRYAFVAMVVMFLMALLVGNVRRGNAGRRLLAVRTNERAAAALGVSVYGAKLYGFMLGAGLAALGGSLLAFMQPSILTSQFDVLSSINLVSVTVVGGVGTIGGAFFGATLIPNGIFSQILSRVADLNEWLPLIGGVFVIYVLLFNPDGLFETNRQMLFKLGGLVKHVFWQSGKAMEVAAAPEPLSEATVRAERVQPMELHAENVEVRFGGVIAVKDVSVTVTPGVIHGVIGPNGAGKTTLIDAITGFVRPSGGQITLGETAVGSWSVQRRAHAGIARSFQSVELFPDLTVRENLALASESRGVGHYLASMVRPEKAQLSGTGLAAIREFGLEEHLDSLPDSLPFGQRRLVDIARAVSTGASVLLLDEPAAGLDDTESAELGELVRTLATDWGIAVLLVEHNMDLVLSVCDKVTVMVQGETLVVGTPDEVRSHPGVLETYLGDSGGGDQHAPDAPSPSSTATT
jgi:ABC-type branched-subunit amino acid transport system ATPase component/branched-subunit amino acid ABC-type transport system permease component